MKIKNLLDQFSQSSLGTKIAIVVLIITWAAVLVTIALGVFLLSLEKPGQAAQTTPGGFPAIIIQPTSGPLGITVTVEGEGWPAGSKILLYLTTPEMI